jgi:hypothetical protein
MAIFELELNHWDAAYTRFINQVLPTAATTEDALTDAPALLWRLVLAAPRPIKFPWNALRATALTRMQRKSEPFVELHNLLALAGAGDFASIGRWLELQTTSGQSRREHLVEQMAIALRAMARGSYEYAAATMRRTVPQLSKVGGSRAQNQLFQQLQDYCWSLRDQSSSASFEISASRSSSVGGTQPRSSRLPNAAALPFMTSA